jgi:hypothetical protein
MSLCISVVIPEGIVMAGESRQTQVIGGVNRIGSDNAIKVFNLTNTVLASTAGWAFLRPQGATMARNISSLSYAIYFNTMTVQDAIDFAVGLIQITITIQRFTAGITTQLGAVAGVGGPIDVAVVRPGKNISWVARKELHS